jgi:hypothetical protein
VKRAVGVGILVVFASCTGCRGGEPQVSRDAGVFLPDTIGALSLDKVDAFRPEFREAAAAAALRITQDGKSPALSFAEIANASNDEIVIHIWPASMFGGTKPRGGGGKSLYFSRKGRRIVRGEAWQ